MHHYRIVALNIHSLTQNSLIVLTQIKFKKEGQIARITLFRPDKMNALTEQMLVEWRQVLEELKDDKDLSLIHI